MSDGFADVLLPVDRFFTAAVAEHGHTPKANDWPSDAQQQIRFGEIARLFRAARFSVLDYGCGTGALLDYLRAHEFTADYWGYDLSSAMIASARAAHAEVESRFSTELRTDAVYDYVVASGIFNIKFDNDVRTWETMIETTLDRFDALSRRGFAFNMLSSYREPHRKLPHLYYGDPRAYFDRCFRRYSVNIAVTHDYDLWDFTLVVRKMLP